jgi:hypothetical protein
MLKVQWKGRVFFKGIQWILEGIRNSKEVFMQLFPIVKWSHWREEQTHYRNNACHVEWEEFARLLLGKSDNNYSLYHKLSTHDGNSWHDTQGKIHM